MIKQNTHSLIMPDTYFSVWLYEDNFAPGIDCFVQFRENSEVEIGEDSVVKTEFDGRWIIPDDLVGAHNAESTHFLTYSATDNVQRSEYTVFTKILKEDFDVQICN